MRLNRIFRRSAVLLAAAMITAVPQQSFAAPFGALGRAIAEQLGLLVAMVPDQLPLNVPLLITVVSPDALTKQGLTGLKANDQVRVTLLEGGKLSVVPVYKTSTTQTLSTAPTLKSGTLASPTVTTSTATTTILKQSLLLTLDAKGAITSRQLIPLDANLQLEAPTLIKR
ncbi:MAG TPA: hypothetical protein VFD22_13975 [Gemmatimonadaceae bacterium]|nr:hypothetical protein [Gemmatimonadaceae bacterium]